MSAQPRAAGVVGGPRWQRAILPLACGVLSFVQWFPVFRERGSTGFGDWQMIQHNWEAAYVSVVRFGQWPLWDPFHCGGISIFRNPESQVYSPFFPLSFAFGTVWAVKLMLWAHVAIGLWGMARLARDAYHLHWLASAVAAFAWACSGCIVWDGAGGHATFLPFTFTPWLIWLVRSDRTLRRKAAWIALLFVVTLYEGGTYPLPFFVLLLGFELALLVLRTPGRLTWPAFRDALVLGAAVLALTALTGVIRIVPSVIALREFPRQVPNDDSVNFFEVIEMLTARDHAWRSPEHPFVWAEYGSYMGWPLVILGAAGIVLVAIRGPRQLLAGLGLFGSIMLGNLGRFAPWSLLHALPVFDSLRVPTRFAMFFTLYLALLAAQTIQALLVVSQRNLLASRAVLVVLTLLAAAQLYDVIEVSRPVVELWRGAPLDDAPPAQRHHLVAGRYGQRYASYPRLNLGTPQCYAGAMNWRVSRALWIGDKPQVRVHEGEGTVYEVRHTSSTWSADVEMKSPGRIWFNQNFADGWRTSAGLIVSDRDLLAVDLPPGRHAVQLRYAPSELGWCVLLSAFGFIAIAVVGFFRLPL